VILEKKKKNPICCSENSQSTKKEFITAEELKKYCKTINITYEITIRHLLSRGHAIRIFKGIFYIKTPEETKFTDKNTTI
jgi:hypothetical protein